MFYHVIVKSLCFDDVFELTLTSYSIHLLNFVVLEFSHFMLLYRSTVLFGIRGMLYFHSTTFIRYFKLLAVKVSIQIQI